MAETETEIINISSVVVDTPPLVTTTSPLNSDPLAQTRGDIILTKDGKLINKVVEYFEFNSDIVAGYNSMLKDIKYLISGNPIKVNENEYVIFPSEKIEFVTGNKHSTYYQQREESYMVEIKVVAQHVKVQPTPSGELQVTQIIKYSGEESTTISIGKIPIMQGSELDFAVINRLNDIEKKLYGECPDDPTGFFSSVQGNEYAFVNQDKLRLNQSFSYFDTDAFNNQMTCSNRFGVTKSQTLYKSKYGSFLIRLDFTGTKKTDVGVNIFVILKILLDELSRTDINLFNSLDIKNIITDVIEKHIVTFTKKEWVKDVVNELNNSVIYFNQLFIADDKGKPQDEFTYLESIRSVPRAYVERKREFFVKNVIGSLFFQYEPTEIYNKFLHTCMTIARVAEITSGKRSQSNRDDWSNKRVVTAGPKMYQLFTRCWYDIIDKVDKDMIEKKGKKNPIEMIASKVRDTKIENIFERSFISNWGTSKKYSTERMTDILKRESKLAPYAQISRISRSGSKEGKNIDPLKVEMSQYGYIDPVDTPDGIDGCGRIRNRSITCWITVYRQESEAMIMNQIKGYIREKNDVRGFDDLVIINGKIKGFCKGFELRDIAVGFRRSGNFYFDTTILYIEGEKSLYIHTDAGRLLRPLLIINQETGGLVISEKNAWELPFDQLITNGSIEYVDAYEQQYLRIAKSVSSIEMDAAVLDTRIAQLNRMIEFRVIERPPDNSEQLIRENQEKLRNLEMVKDLLLKRAQTLVSDYEGNVRGIRFSELNEEEKQTPTVELNINLEYNLTRIKKENEKTVAKIKSTVETIAALEKKMITPLGETSDIDSQIVEVEKEIRALKSRMRYTHCEIHPSAIFGISASLIPMANRNQSVRAGFQCGMSRQSLGIFHANAEYRFDTSAKALAVTSRPLFESQFSTILGLNKYAGGENIILAIMPLMGFNQEDSILFNRQSIENGMFHMWAYKAVSTTIDTKTAGVKEEITKDVADLFKSPIIYRHLDDNGIARPESRLKIGDCIIGKVKHIQQPGGTVRHEDASVYANNDHEDMIVDRIINTSSNTAKRIVKIKLRQYRIPIHSDKFGSRIAQKSTVGLILNEADMPFSHGVHIDAIINPHAFPSRMTLIHLIEMLVSKAAVLTGTRVNATSFEKLDIPMFQKILTDYGYDMHGREKLRMGTTGEEIEGLVYVGPIQYQALKHHVKDKIQARQRGPIDPKSRQPQGRRTGGQAGKIGEMERDNFISHGAAGLLQETHCISSAKHSCVVCTNCGQMGTTVYTGNKFECSLCRADTRAAICEIPYARYNMNELLNVTVVSQKYEFELKEKI